jgi:hypothetical protein
MTAKKVNNNIDTKHLNNMAKFNFLNLDEETRRLMLLEIENDLNKELLYVSDRLNDLGKKNYQDYLIQSAKEGDEESFEKLPSPWRVSPPVQHVCNT